MKNSQLDFHFFRSNWSQTFDDFRKYTIGAWLVDGLSGRCDLEDFHWLCITWIRCRIDGRPSHQLYRRNMVELKSINFAWPKTIPIYAIFLLFFFFSEPSTRGVLVSLSFITTAFGMFLGLFLNTLMPWRSIAAVCLAFPIITAIAICFVSLKLFYKKKKLKKNRLNSIWLLRYLQIPETPQWLLSKNRTLEAEKSLRWLRGWISSGSGVVAQELHDLQKHSERSNSCNTCIKRDQKCTHPLPTLSEKFVELKRKRTFKPLFIIIFMFCVGQFSGLYSMRPFIVQIFKAYETPLPPDQSAAMLSLIESLACCVFVGLIRFTGRRRLYLITSFGAFVCSGVISCYGFIYLPSDYVSFDLTHGAYHMENAILRYIPTVFLILFSFFSCCGFITIPWILVSEIFPMKWA